MESFKKNSSGTQTDLSSVKNKFENKMADKNKMAESKTTETNNKYVGQFRKANVR